MTGERQGGTQARLDCRLQACQAALPGGEPRPPTVLFPEFPQCLSTPGSWADHWDSPPEQGEESDYVGRRADHPPHTVGPTLQQRLRPTPSHTSRGDPQPLLCPLVTPLPIRSRSLSWFPHCPPLGSQAHPKGGVQHCRGLGAAISGWHSGHQCWDSGPCWAPRSSEGLAPASCATHSLLAWSYRVAASPLALRTTPNYPHANAV